VLHRYPDNVKERFGGSDDASVESEQLNMNRQIVGPTVTIMREKDPRMFPCFQGYWEGSTVRLF
jgi:hypothetical protein